MDEDEICRMKNIFLNRGFTLEMFKLEIDLLSNINVVDHSGHNLLYWCWRLCILDLDGIHELMRYIIGKDINIEQTNNTNETMVIQLSKNGDLDSLKILIENGANINHCDTNYDTALLWGSYLNHIDIVKYLVEHGANIEHRYIDGRNAIMWACKRGNFDIVHYLVQFTTNINLEDRNGDNMISLCEKKEIRDFLLEFIWKNKKILAMGTHSKLLEKPLYDKNIVSFLCKFYNP